MTKQEQHFAGALLASSLAQAALKRAISLNDEAARELALAMEPRNGTIAKPRMIAFGDDIRGFGNLLAVAELSAPECGTQIAWLREMTETAVPA